MKDRGWSQSDLARNSTATQGQISSYLNNTLPEADGLVKLCAAFGNESGVLLAAWLRDKIPTALLGQVDIISVKQPSRVLETPSEPTIYYKLPSRVRKLVDEVAEACARDPKFVAAIETTISLTRPLRVAEGDRNIILAAPPAIVITDAKGRVSYVDAEFTKMCGYTLEELRDKKPGDKLQGAATEQKVVRDFRRAIAARKPFECVITNYTKSQVPYRAHIRMIPLLDTAGKLTGFHALERRLD